MRAGYRKLAPDEVSALVGDPKRYKSDPKMLFLAYLLSAIYEATAEEDEEGEIAPRESVWNAEMPEHTMRGMVEDLIEDYCDCARNYKSVRVWGTSCAIRSGRSVNPEMLKGMVELEADNGICSVSAECLYYPDKGEVPGVHRASPESENREYFKKIVYMAEEESGDGWNRLTDMEVLAYCWGRFANDNPEGRWSAFRFEYSDYICVSDREVGKCFSKRSEEAGTPRGMIAFSARGIMDWNESHGQKSDIPKVSADEAGEYWRNVALNGSFAPKK